MCKAIFYDESLSRQVASVRPSYVRIPILDDNDPLLKQLKQLKQLKRSE